MTIMAWALGNDNAAIAHALSFHPDIINTDRPDIVRRILERDARPSIEAGKTGRRVAGLA